MKDMKAMTEQLTITRTDDGGLRVELQTKAGPNGWLTFTQLLPRAADLSQHRILELQADLLQEAVAVLQRKLQSARLLDAAAPASGE